MTFKGGGGGIKFSRNICEPSKISHLCILLNVVSFSKWASIASTRCSIADCLPFYTAMLNMLLIGSQNRWHKRDLGAHVKNLTGMLVLFFGFEVWPNPIFLSWQIFSYFSGFCKISAIFLGLTNFQLFFWSSYHTLKSFE